MTISMTPSGQPYGKRQQNVAAATEAGLTPTVGQTPPAPRRPRPAGPLTTPQARPSGTFDVFASRTPTGQGRLRMDPDTRVLDLLAQSPSPVLQDLAARLRGF